jgi:hypothetical protein
MMTSDFTDDGLLLRNRLFMVGDFDMPLVYSQDVDVEGLSLLGFNNTNTTEESEKRKNMTVHFFLEDSQFDEVWNNPPRQLRKLSQYAQLLSPDFSVYTDMPEPLQIYNTFRNRWCAAYWQYNCQVVIPTITWGLENTFDFCFDGIEEGCTVAVSTVGALDNRDAFIAGYREMCARIKPEAVINYGKCFEGMEDLAKVIEVPYIHGSHLRDAE